VSLRRVLRRVFPAFSSNTNGSSVANRKSYVKLETDAKRKRIAEEEAKDQATNGS
jgi:hypothetical protein